MCCIAKFVCMQTWAETFKSQQGPTEHKKTNLPVGTVSNGVNHCKVTGTLTVSQSGISHFSSTMKQVLRHCSPVGVWCEWVGESEEILLLLTIDISFKDNVFKNIVWFTNFDEWLGELLIIIKQICLPFSLVRGSLCMVIPSVFIFLWYLSPWLPACQLLCLCHPSSNTQQTDRKQLLTL